MIPQLLLQPVDRRDDTAAIVGNESALRALRAALDQALDGTAAHIHVYGPDGEPACLAILQHDDIGSLCTAYLGEPMSERSLREQYRPRDLPGWVARRCSGDAR